MLLGVVIYFFVSDFPHKSSFLTGEQTVFILKRVEEDRGDSVPDEITLRKVLEHLRDWTIWAYGMSMMVSHKATDSDITSQHSCFSVRRSQPMQ